jgi:hypothetical protein
MIGIVSFGLNLFFEDYETIKREDIDSLEFSLHQMFTDLAVDGKISSYQISHNIITRDDNKIVCRFYFNWLRGEKEDETIRDLIIIDSGTETGTKGILF